jgi:hypothetical protein
MSLNVPGWTWILIAGLCVGAQGEPAAAQSKAEEVIEPVGFGKINWTTGWIVAKGLGIPPAKATPNQARASAERAGYLVALRNLLEIINGVRVDSETVAESYLTRNEMIRTQVSGFVRGAQIVKTEAQPDGSVEVTVKMPLWGGNSLLTALLTEKTPAHRESFPEPQSPEGYTGLVIDTRGLEIKPACFPEILDQQETLLYGPDQVDRAAIEEGGMVEYRTASPDISLSSIFGERAFIVQPVQVAKKPKAGSRPLKIKGIRKAGTLKANVIISSEDAKKIREDPRIGSALGRARVVIVTDPLIGGIQGRGPNNDMLAAAVPGMVSTDGPSGFANRR